MIETRTELHTTDRHRYIVLIIYDIVENKTRTTMSRCLEQYAVRVQRSAFEGFLTPKQYRRLVGEASTIIDEETDSLRIYILSDHTQVLSWGRPLLRDDDVIIY